MNWIDTHGHAPGQKRLPNGQKAKQNDNDIHFSAQRYFADKYRERYNMRDLDAETEHYTIGVTHIPADLPPHNNSHYFCEINRRKHDQGDDAWILSMASDRHRKALDIGIDDVNDRAWVRIVPNHQWHYYDNTATLMSDIHVGSLTHMIPDPDEDVVFDIDSL